MKNNLYDLVHELSRYIDDHNCKNIKISSSTVGWQIDHTLKVINAIVGVLEKSNPENYKKKFNLKRSIFLLRGKIPRGFGKAPKSVQSFDQIDV